MSSNLKGLSEMETCGRGFPRATGDIGGQEGDERVRQSPEELRALATRLQAAREEERERIAREIHDELGQATTVLKLDLAHLRNVVKKSTACAPLSVIEERIEIMIRNVDETLRAIRRITNNLRPRILDELGLAAAIEWQAGEFASRTGISHLLRLESTDADLLDKDRASAIFRIFQELLTNVARHAHASEVQVRLGTTDGCFCLEVSDNGSGIAADQVFSPHTLGLLGIRERAESFGGEVTISSHPREGTTISVKIPSRNI